MVWCVTEYTEPCKDISIKTKRDEKSTVLMLICSVPAWWLSEEQKLAKLLTAASQYKLISNMFIVFNLNFPVLNFPSFTLITLPVCLPKQFFSINGVYSPQISTDCFHICPHTVLYFRQTLFSFMIFPCQLIPLSSPDIVPLLWTLSSHQDGGLGAQCTSQKLWRQQGWPTC